MTPLFWTLVIVIILIFIIFAYSICMSVKESWQNYDTLPFDYISTGSNPMNFYRNDLYRKPYNYPFKFYQSYPLPSMQYTTLL